VVRVADYLAAVIKVTGTWFGDPDAPEPWPGSEEPDASAWSLLGTILASGYFRADVSFGQQDQPDNPEGRGLRLGGGLRAYRLPRAPRVESPPTE